MLQKYLYNIFWSEKRINEQFRGIKEVEITIKKFKWNWIGYILSRRQGNIAKQSFDFNIDRKKRRKIKRHMYKKHRTEIKKKNMTWKEMNIHRLNQRKDAKGLQSCHLNLQSKCQDAPYASFYRYHRNKKT